MRSLIPDPQTFRASCALPAVCALVLGGLPVSASAQASSRSAIAEAMVSVSAAVTSGCLDAGSVRTGVATPYSAQVYGPTRSVARPSWPIAAWRKPASLTGAEALGDLLLEPPDQQHSAQELDELLARPALFGGHECVPACSRATRSTKRQLYPHSLSYQPNTFTSLPFAIVSSLS